MNLFKYFFQSNLIKGVSFMPHKSQLPVKEVDELKRLEYHLNSIIKNESIYPVFQPIIDLKTGQTFGYESLSRLKDRSVIDNPEELFITAKKFGQTARLEKLCRKKILLKANELKLPGNLTINICPSVLKAVDHEKGFTAALIRELSTINNQVILELTERYYIKDYSLFKETVDHYRQQGFRIAIDDLGSGFSDLKMLLSIEPYMVKIDRFLISNIHKSIKKQRLLKALVTFCHDINAIVTAECVEKKEELEILIDMEVDCAQGYYLGKPDQSVTECSEEAKEVILKFNLKKRNSDNNQLNSSINSLIQYIEPVQDSEIIMNISERFKKDKTLTSIPVLNGQKPVGIVNKRELYYRLGQQFGFDLFSKKSIKAITESSLTFDINISIEEVSKRVINRDEKSIYDAVIITKNGAYSGIVKIHHVLERLTDQKIKLAQQANPLTGLPGNVLIKEKIESRLNKKQIFAVMYFDLDNFKPFNDNFGFELGDYVLQFLGTLLKNIITKWDKNSFIGHVGGDDFIAVCRSQDIEKLCNLIIERFDQDIKMFHDKETWEKGYYESIDRQGNIKKFNLLSISIAVLSTKNRLYHSFGHIASIASEVKKEAKKINGSGYAVDRRKD